MHMVLKRVSYIRNGSGAGGEDGYVRLHHFDNDYHATSFF